MLLLLLCFLVGSAYCDWQAVEKEVFQEARELHRHYVDMTPVLGMSCSGVSPCGALPLEDGCLDLCEQKDGTLSYIPVNTQLQGKHFPSGARRAMLRDAAQLRAALDARQHDACISEEQRPLVATIPFDGLGSMIHTTITWLGWAFLNNRTFWPMYKGSLLSLHPFPPIASCKVRIGRLSLTPSNFSTSVAMPPCGHADMVAVMLTSTEHELERDIDGNVLGVRKLHGFRDGFAPAAYAQHGSFWFHSQLLDFIWRLSPDLAVAFDEERAQLGLGEHPVIGMHVRRGDKCGELEGEGAPRGVRPALCDLTMTDFELAAQRMRTRYGVTQIFLATDSLDAVEACQRWPGRKAREIAGRL